MGNAVATQPDQETTAVVIPTVTNVRISDVRKAWDRQTMEERLSEIRTATDAITRAGEPLMLASAKAIVNAKDYSGMVGSGPECVWPTDVALYRAVLGTPNKTYGLRLMRLGRAMARHGMRHGGADWQFLQNYADAGYFGPILGKGLDQAVSDEDFRKAMAEARRLQALHVEKGGEKDTFPSAARIKALQEGVETKRAPQLDDGSKGDDDDSTPPAPTSKPRTLGDWRVAVRALMSELKAVPDEMAPEVHALIVNGLKSDIDARKAYARKAKADGTTPKPTAPKGKTAVPAPATVEAKAEPTTPEQTPESVA